MKPAITQASMHQLNKLLSKTISLPGLRKKEKRAGTSTLGAAPGIEYIANIEVPPADGEVQIRCIDYSEDRLEETHFENIEACLQTPRPDWASHRWLNVDGLHPYVVNQLKLHFNIHTLAAEDVLNVPQRPKVEGYENTLFIVSRMLMMRHERLTNEQVSIFCFDNTLITIQETPGDVWDTIRTRLTKKGSRLRTMGSTYLLYALLDAIVDHTFPLLEKYGDILSEMESQVLADPSDEMQQRIHEIKRELSLLRRVMWPMRETINVLYHDEDHSLSDAVKPFFRDVYDHIIQVIDIIETYREVASSLHDLYMSAVSNRMNEVMKVLTIMASLFIPITFLAGVYGMNFEHIPELNWAYAYPVFWSLCGIITSGLLIFFRKRKWI